MHSSGSERGGRHRDIMKNGLYSIHVTLLDGAHRQGQRCDSVSRRGQILGGVCLSILHRHYTVKTTASKAEVLVQSRHTSSPDANPLFGGRAVGIGVTGTFTDTRATMNGTALVAKRASLRRHAAQARRMWN